MRQAPRLFLLFLLTACATTPDLTVAERERADAGFERETVDLLHEKLLHATEYAAPRERVYHAVLNAYETMQLPLQSADPAATTVRSFVQTNRLRIEGRRASEYLDCGHGPAGPRADRYRITLTATSHVEPLAENRTRLRTVVSGSARDTGTSSSELECVSTGALEKAIAARVAARLPQAPPRTSP